MYYLLLLIVFLAALILFIHFKRIYIATSAMAVVMAFGIVTEGALLSFFGMPFFLGIGGKLLSILNFSLWISFLFSFTKALMDGRFIDIHIRNPINRFGIGTWIAGTSICGIICYKQFIHWEWFSEAVVFLNAGLWILYAGISVKTFYVLKKTPFHKKAHGILLLTTVSTQSIVLLMNTVFRGIPHLLNIILLVTGACFYIISTFFILRRYFTTVWTIETDWNNTNCILHGAISITGLACLVTNSLGRNMIYAIWSLSFLAFLLVESIEIWRLIKRIRVLGFKRGLFLYDVTQWSRIFTFAMFYTFTSSITSPSPLMHWIKNGILHAGIAVILLLLLAEVLLCLRFIQTTYQVNRKQNETKVTLPF